MIFVTLGSQKFQFNRLLKQLDYLIEVGVIKEDIFAQIGYSDYKPSHYQYVDFLDRNEFFEKMNNSGTLITHGGTGAIITGVKAGKKVLVVPRLQKFNEHVDDHQMQIFEEFKKSGYVVGCQEVEDLGTVYKSINDMSFKTYVSNTKVIIQNIEEFINDI